MVEVDWMLRPGCLGWLGVRCESYDLVVEVYDAANPALVD